MKAYENDGVCNTYWGCDKCMQKYCWKTVKGINYLEHQVCREVGCEGLDWIEHGQDRVMWWGFVNTKLNLRVT